MINKMREQKLHWIPNLSSGLIYSYILAIPLSSSFLPSPLISPLPSSSLSFSYSTSFPHSTRTTAKYNDLKGEWRTMMTVSPLWFLKLLPGILVLMLWNAASGGICKHLRNLCPRMTYRSHGPHPFIQVSIYVQVV